MADASRERIHGVDILEPHTRLLRIKVVQATDLHRRDFLGGVGDPYVKISLQSFESRHSTIATVRTHAVPKTSNPLWNEDFTFRVCRKKQTMERRSIIEVIRSIQIDIDLYSKYMIKINWYVRKILFDLNKD